MIIVKESSNLEKSPLIVGLILKQKAEGNKKGIHIHNNCTSYTKMLSQKFESALKQNRIRYKSNTISNEEGSRDINFGYAGEKYQFSLYPFLIPLKLNELLKKKPKIIDDYYEEEVCKALNDDLAIWSRKKRYDSNELTIQQFILFIPATVKLSFYNNDDEDDYLIKINLSSLPFEKYHGDFSDYIGRKRNRESLEYLEFN